MQMALPFCNPPLSPLKLRGDKRGVRLREHERGLEEYHTKKTLRTINYGIRKRMSICTIDFEPVGRRSECQSNETLLACARRLGVGISSICGGMGTCHACKVQVLSGTVSEPTSHEIETFTPQELKEGWRLACQTYPTSDCRLNVPPESMTTSQRVQIEGLEIAVQPEPTVQAYRLQLTAPTLTSPHADDDNLLDAINQQYQLHQNRVDIHLFISCLKGCGRGTGNARLSSEMTK
jgi:uncharacterized 2Fe-2S/4Fe-4S cluster protein (DUF4445 family)